MSGLRLIGQSVPPYSKEKHARPPEENAARTLDKKQYTEQTVFVRKDRSGFGGGFKIPEEYRRNKLKRRGEKRKLDDEDSFDAKDAN